MTLIMASSSYGVSICSFDSNDGGAITGANFGSTSVAFNLTGSFGQSFTACKTGILDSIGVLALSASSGITITVYSGGGNGGTSLGSVSGLSVSANAAINDRNILDISSANISVDSGLVYSFFVTAGSISTRISNSSIYSGGSAFSAATASTTNDFLFSINISAASAPLSSSISSQTNNICNGDALGSLTVTASDGTTPYTYNWSNTSTTATINTLAAGTYTVTVTDAGGTTSTSSAIITEPTALNTTISSQTNVACFGENTGSLTASVTGGTSPYTYNWNSGETSATITGKAAGTYTVSVLDANGCGEGPPP